MWLIDALPSSQHGSRHVLPHSFWCFEGRVATALFVIPKRKRSLLISVAIWGRDTKIVILTGSFWLVNLGGAIYGKFFYLSLSRSAVEVLIILFIALTRVGFSFGPIYFNAKMTIFS